jgi:hypothetical protein
MARFRMPPSYKELDSLFVELSFEGIGACEAMNQ